MTEHTKRFDDTIWGKAMKLWPLIVALVSVVVMATTIKDKIDNHEIRLQKVENVINSMDDKLDKLVYELIDKNK